MTQRANDFIIWRAGKSVKWECTAAEIAAETGIHVVTVHETCRRRGWDVQRGNISKGGSNRQGVDHIMGSPHMQRSGQT